MTTPTSGQTVDALSMGASGVADTANDPGKSKNRARAVPFFAGVAAVLLLIPVAVYFGFIHQYGVNAIYYDQWNDVALLTHTRVLHPLVFWSYHHQYVVGEHNENHTVFPDLVVLALGALTNLNIVTELYLSAFLLLITLVLIILAHRQDVSRTRLVYYLPVAFLVFTLGQFENTLLGYQFWLYLVITILAATIFFLNLPRVSWPILFAAIAMAVIGSYSALDGLVIWSAGLVVLLWKRRPRAFVAAWLISGIATTGLYFYHYDFAAASPGGATYLFVHPLSAAIFSSLHWRSNGDGLRQSPGASEPAYCRDRSRHLSSRRGVPRYIRATQKSFEKSGGTRIDLLWYSLRDLGDNRASALRALGGVTITFCDGRPSDPRRLLSLPARTMACSRSRVRNARFRGYCGCLP